MAIPGPTGAAVAPRPVRRLLKLKFRKFKFHKTPSPAPTTKLNLNRQCKSIRLTELPQAKFRRFRPRSKSLRRGISRVLRGRVLRGRVLRGRVLRAMVQVDNHPRVKMLTRERVRRQTTRRNKLSAASFVRLSKRERPGCRPQNQMRRQRRQRENGRVVWFLHHQRGNSIRSLIPN